MDDQIKDDELDTTPPDQPKPEVREEPPKKSNGARIAILLAILIAIALVTLGYMAYRAGGLESALERDDSSEVDLPEAEEEQGPAEAADVDEAIDEIDQELENLEEDDFNNEDLEDDSLGL